MSILSVKIAAKLSGAVFASGTRRDFQPRRGARGGCGVRAARRQNPARGAERAGAREAAESGARSRARLRFVPQPRYYRNRRDVIIVSVSCA